VPRVVSWSESYLLMEDLGQAAPPSIRQWETFGRQVARLHALHNDRFGFDYDNYLGLTVQVNDWREDGYEFTVGQRVLPYVEQGRCAEILDRADREKIERFCSKLGGLVPSQPASLCHGDLWTPNVLATRWGDMAYVDPALHYGWAGADVSLTFLVTPFPEAFYAAYLEVHPLQAGWRERTGIYLIVEYLVTMATFGNRYGSVDDLRRLLDRYV
jgi:fructosamine-3-kinase